MSRLTSGPAVTRNRSPSGLTPAPVVPSGRFTRGRLVVVADIGGHREIVGDAGLTFRCADVADLARVLRRVLDEPDLAAALADRARIKFAIARFGKRSPVRASHGARTSSRNHCGTKGTRLPRCSSTRKALPSSCRLSTRGVWARM